MMALDPCIKKKQTKKKNLHYVITWSMEAEPVESKLMEVESTECCINGQKHFLNQLWELRAGAGRDMDTQALF